MSTTGLEANKRKNLIRKKKASRLPINTTLKQALEKAGLGAVA